MRDSITDSLLATQFFIATAALTSLVLAAVTAERSRAARALRSARRASARWPTSMPRCAGWPRSSPPRRRPSRVFQQVTEEVGRLLGLPARPSSSTTAGGRGDRRRRLERGGRLPLPVGASLDLDGGDGVVAKVLRTGTRPAPGELRRGAAAASPRSCATPGTAPRSRRPSTVGGRLWGALVAATAVGRAAARGSRAAAL